MNTDPYQESTGLLNTSSDAEMLTIEFHDNAPLSFQAGPVKVPEAGRWKMIK
jgi:hypothetical protein